jgi:hypothetical protein
MGSPWEAHGERWFHGGNQHGSTIQSSTENQLETRGENKTSQKKKNPKYSTMEFLTGWK